MIRIPRLIEKGEGESQWSITNPFSTSWSIEVEGFATAHPGCHERYNVFSVMMECTLLKYKPKQTISSISSFYQEFDHRNKKTNMLHRLSEYILGHSL